MKRRNLVLLVVLVLALLGVAIQPLLAQSGNVWYVQYFNNPNWSSGPIVTMNSQYVDFNWGTVAPAPGMPSENWTATMTSSAYFYAGTYLFYALADDEISVQVDNVTYVNTIGAGKSGQPIQVYVPMAQGYHNVVVQYRQYTGTAYVYLNWSYMKQDTGYPTPLPPPVVVTPLPYPTPTPSCNPSYSCTCPVQATSVQTQYGDYTSCIQQNLHQSACYQSNGQWDAPNTGSIETEPKIQVWGACTPGAKQTMQLACNQPPQSATCSKTGAGWFFY